MKKISKLSIKHQIYFIKRLSFLLKSGTSLTDCILILHLQATKNKKLFSIILEDLSQGSYLYQSLKKFPSSFNPLAISLIRSGEESSTLPENLQRLAIELQKRQRLHQKFISALIYPSFITIATLCLSSFLLFFIFPKIRPLFTNLSIPLPWTTRLLINITHVPLGIMIFCLFFFVISFYLFVHLYRENKKYRTSIDSILLKIPILGRGIKQYELVTYFYTISIMLQGGAPIDHACLVASEVCSNILYKKSSISILQSITTGKSLADGLYTHQHLYPKEFVDMIQAAESAGTLSETLLYISEMYEQELEETTKNIGSALEPLLMIGMGLIVGFISLSIITPIYSITQNLKH